MKLILRLFLLTIFLSACTGGISRMPTDTGDPILRTDGGIDADVPEDSFSIRFQAVPNEIYRICLIGLYLFNETGEKLFVNSRSNLRSGIYSEISDFNDGEMRFPRRSIEMGDLRDTASARLLFSNRCSQLEGSIEHVDARDEVEIYDGEYVADLSASYGELGIQIDLEGLKDSLRESQGALKKNNQTRGQGHNGPDLNKGPN